MQAGALRHRITLLRREVTTSSTGTGRRLEDWTEAGRPWCQVTPLRQVESDRGPAPDAVAMHRFRIRYRDEVDTTWQLEWRGRRYEITEALPGGRGLTEFLDLMAFTDSSSNPVE